MITCECGTENKSPGFLGVREQWCEACGRLTIGSRVYMPGEVGREPVYCPSYKMNIALVGHTASCSAQHASRVIAGWPKWKRRLCMLQSRFGGAGDMDSLLTTWRKAGCTGRGFLEWAWERCALCKRRRFWLCVSQL